MPIAREVVIPASYAYAVRKRLTRLAWELADRRSIDLCAECKVARCDHKREGCAAFREPPEALDTKAAREHLEDATAAYARLCGACNRPSGEHGADANCHCGHGPEDHGDPTYDHKDREWRRCKICKKPRWVGGRFIDPPYQKAEPDRNGICKSYETAAGAELCEPLRAKRRIAAEGMSFKDYEFPSTPEEIEKWYANRLKTETEARARLAEQQEVNHALLVGPVVEKPKRQRRQAR